MCICASTCLLDGPEAELLGDLDRLGVFVHSQVEMDVLLLQYDVVPMLIIQQTAEGDELPGLRG